MAGDDGIFLAPGEIEDYARRYVEIPKERGYPLQGELFARLLRDRPADRVLKDEEGWVFAGYGLCLGYTLNEEAKPLGKSLWWWFVDLAVFPPRKLTFKLQPPHVVLGKFNLAGGGQEMRVLRLTGPEIPAEPSTGAKAAPTEPAPARDPEAVDREPDAGADPDPGKILRFRPKGKAP